MSARSLSYLIVLTLIVAGCSSSSQSTNRLATSDDVAADPLPTALPTTNPITDTPAPGPTPITLRGGQGIVVATPDPDAPAEMPDDTTQDAASSEDDSASGTDDGNRYNQAVGSAGQDSYNGAVGPGETASETPEVTPTPVPRPTPIPASTGAAGDGNTGTAEDSTDPSVDIANGAEIYTWNCARCHGEGGLGSIHRGLVGTGAKYTQASLVDELTNGHAFTFGFGDKLSATEISDVVAYVRASFG